jgi:hypothetical protein
MIGEWCSGSVAIPPKTMQASQRRKLALSNGETPRQHSSGALVSNRRSHAPDRAHCGSMLCGSSGLSYWWETGAKVAGHSTWVGSGWKAALV